MEKENIDNDKPSAPVENKSPSKTGSKTGSNLNLRKGSNTNLSTKGSRTGLNSSIKNLAVEANEEVITEQPNEEIKNIPEPAKPQVSTVLLPFSYNKELAEHLFLSYTTIKLFEFDIAELTSESGAIVKSEKLQFYFVAVPNVLADIQTRGIISEFQNSTKQILNSKLDQLLLIYDRFENDKYVFLTLYDLDSINDFCTTHGLIPHVQKLKQSYKKQGWFSLGSEKEIEEEKSKPTRNKLNVIISKTRREFGKQYQFHDRDAIDTIYEIKSTKTENDLGRLQKNVGIQASSQSCTMSTQTNWFRPLNFSCQYEPIEFTKEEKDLHLQNPALIGLCSRYLPKIEFALTENLIIDTCKNEFHWLGEDDAGIEQGVQASLIEFQSFTDLKHSKDRSISCIDWHPTLKGVAAVSCAQCSTWDEKIEMGYHAKSKNSVLLIWNFMDPIHPQLILEGPDEIQSFKFCPSNSNLIIGGCSNGQIVIWDIYEHRDRLRYKKQTSANEEKTVVAEKQVETPIVHHVATSSIEFSHRGQVSDLFFVPKHLEIQPSGEVTDAKSNTEYNQFVSVSLDGQVFFWDLRFRKEAKLLDMVWRPFIKIPLSSMDNTFDYGCTKVSMAFRSPSLLTHKGNAADHLDFVCNDKALLSKFFCGTEEGDLLISDWIAEKTEEKASRVEFAWNSNFGSIVDLQRSPYFNDILLCVETWCFHLWKEGILTGPLISSHIYKNYLTGGRWSPTRAGVFYIIKSDGYIEAWDLADRSHEPSLIQSVSTYGLTYITLNPHNYSNIQYLALGDDNGTLHVLQVPKLLSKTSKNEKSVLKTFFEREIKRIRYLEERKILQRLEKQPEAPAAEPKPDAAVKSEEAVDDEENQEKHYKNMEKDFLDRIALQAQ